MSIGQTSLPDMLSALPASQIPFVAFRLPENNKVELWARTDGKLQILHHINELNGKEGFLLHPFQVSQKHPFLFIEPNYKYHSSERLDIPTRITAGNPIFDDEPDLQTNEEIIFLEQLSELIAQLKAGKAAKVVLSRRFSVPKLTENQISALFIELTRQYPGAMVYYLFFPGYGCWLGATPEILLRTGEQQAQTVALAGTRESGAIPNWGKKERKEQEIVSRFIKSKLRTNKMQNIIFSKPYSAKAGGVEHLRTDLSFDNPGFAGLCNLVHSLHPTPAVGGWPLNESLQLIEQFEKRNREYYAGFLGTIGSWNQLNLFVNIRCMKIANNGFQIFSGAGITAASDPLKELEETRMKADTLLAIIEKIQNLAI